RWYKTVPVWCTWFAIGDCGVCFSFYARPAVGPGWTQNGFGSFRLLPVRFGWSEGAIHPLLSPIRASDPQGPCRTSAREGLGIPRETARASLWCTLRAESPPCHDRSAHHASR